MTPFGEKMRALRKKHGTTQKQMAADLQITAAYLSALEHGHRGRPSPGLVMQICGYFNIIWDEAENLKKLAKMSHPRVSVNTAGLSPKATELTNKLAANIHQLPDNSLQKLIETLDEETGRLM